MARSSFKKNSAPRNQARIVVLSLPEGGGAGAFVDAPVRVVTEEDLLDLDRIEVECFPADLYASSRLTREHFLECMELEDCCLIAGVLRGRIVGYTYLYMKEEDAAHIASIAVDSAVRGRHIGEKMLCLAEKTGEQMGAVFMGLDVHEKNTAALNLYVKAGYTPTGRRMPGAAYGDGTVGIELRKELTAPARRAQPSSGGAYRKLSR